MWWSSKHDYKNAVTNELFLMLSASGFNRFGDTRYLDNAKKVSIVTTFVRILLILNIDDIADVELA